jgi:Protein of unknown function (DUF664)
VNDGVTKDLHRYLQEARDSIVASLDGLNEYGVRRPMTSTGTSLLGLVKHLAGIELSYLGDSVGRPAPIVLPWVADGSIWDGADMWAQADESREYLVGLYRAAWAHSDESIAQLPLDAPADVAWWPAERRRTTFGSLVVRVVAETAQHAGHCDIVRETIDGRAGSDTSAVNASTRSAYVEKVQRAADAHRV